MRYYLTEKTDMKQKKINVDKWLFGFLLQVSDKNNW